MKAVGTITEKAYFKTFEQGVNFFLRAMRARSFVAADRALLQKFGDSLHSEITHWCFENGITVRMPDGRLALSRPYNKPKEKVEFER